MLSGIHSFYWRKEVEKTLEEIWQQTKDRDGAREMKQHVEQFSNTRREQRAAATAKERELLEQEAHATGFSPPRGGGCFAHIL